MKIVLLLTLFLPFSALHASDDEEDRPEVFGKHHGYVFDVEEERNKRDIEMVMLEKPKHDEKPATDVIFNEKLTKEFQQQYKYRFGQTSAEQIFNSPSRSDGYSYYTGVTVGIQEYQKYQQQFAEYMSRRLIEFHVDDWAKKDPDFRPVYELKDKVSSLNVDVKSYKFKWKYNFSGPHMDFSLENPYGVDTKVRVEMNGIVSAPDEIIYSLGFPVSPRVYVQAVHKQEDGIYQLIGTRRLTKSISTSLTCMTDQSDKGESVKQDLYLVGLSWSD